MRKVFGIGFLLSLMLVFTGGNAFAGDLVAADVDVSVEALSEAGTSM